MVRIGQQRKGEAVLSGETPSTTAPRACTVFQLSRNSQASVVQPLVSSLG